eukprot:TRINITY_DN77702_c0_g1_i1.p1 TRINITY_DN77702_c0_g1~~TRINITY_DN77702_c0_g1_i1.p1  ORF type:complete len:419 (+),score=71.31 TRINITY_DN77702_c0_g1_i1:85-1257(+)
MDGFSEDGEEEILDKDGELKTYRDYKNEQRQLWWDKFEAVVNAKQSPDFFHGVKIARDGGFSEVRELWDGSRWFSAFMVLLLLASNLYTVITNDMMYLIQGGHPSERSQNDDIRNDFMLTGYFADWLARLYLKVVGHDENFISPRLRLISGVELFLLACLLAQAIVKLVRTHSAKTERLRWLATQEFLWKVIPELTSFSAMRLLHYATPSIIIADAYTYATKYGSQANAVKFRNRKRLLIGRWARLIVWRFLCLVIGVDAFLFKVRISYKFIHQANISAFGLLTVVMFIVQVLGIVQLSIFVRGRIFLFIFGGEDGIMQQEERCIQVTWETMIVREIYRQFTFWQAMAVLLSFSDYDFQKLVLNENANLMSYLSSGETSEADSTASELGS